jgi:4,5-DOPA dioxygenase extradiol
VNMPALFVGHGSPMNAIEDGPFRRSWSDLGRRLPRPRAILCVSAHWETRGVRLTAAEAPVTIHDFYGFPQPLFDVRYAAPGDPGLARRVASMLADASPGLDLSRGLDHGCWSVLLAMYPEADVPVLQLSLDTRQPASFHYGLARGLAPLREDGVLVVGSGNLVHNLRLADFGLEAGYDWAVRFDAELGARIQSGDHAALVDYAALGDDAARAIPTPEHYLPLLYVLALETPRDALRQFNERCVLGSISMRSIVLEPHGGQAERS